MRARTAALLAPAVLASSLTAVGGAQAVPVTSLTPTRALPAATQPYQLAYDRDLRPAEGIRPNRAVFVADAAGQNEQRVTKPADPAQAIDDHDVAFSPDGTKMVYVEDPDPDNTDAHDQYLVVADADGSNPRRLNGTVTQSFLYGPTWSPDAKTIAYGVESDGSSIQFVDVSSGSGIGFVSFQPFFDFSDPAWSPSDPATIAATAQNQNGQQLVRLTVSITGDGANVVALTVLDSVAEPSTVFSGSGCPRSSIQGLLIDPSTEVGPEVEDAFPAFSPDGGTIAFSGYGGHALCEVGVDGNGGHLVSLTGPALPPRITNSLRVASLAFAPDGTFLAAEMDTVNSDGQLLHTQLWALTPIQGQPVVSAELYVDGVARPAFDIQTGPVTLTVTAKPTPGYVGGHTVDVQYTLDNQTGRTIASPTLVAQLPPQLPLAAGVSPTCKPESCQLGDVAPRTKVSVTFPLTPAQAVSALASGTVTFTNPQGAQQLLTGQAPVVVKQPLVIINPTVGPPGIVTVATGASFPPGAKVRFTWTPGITAPTTVTVKADGTFVKQVLVLPHDTLGPRTLTVHGFTGPQFGDLTLPFLVVPGDPQPPRFFGRG